MPNATPGAARVVRGRSAWRGSFREGDGTISTASDTLRGAPYTFASRFDGAPGACPEELLAAAHAGCLNHALANVLGMHGLTPERVDTAVDVTMGRDARGAPAVAAIHITLEARVPDVAPDDFRRLAAVAAAGCAISKALRLEPTLDARLLDPPPDGPPGPSTVTRA